MFAPSSGLSLCSPGFVRTGISRHPFFMLDPLGMLRQAGVDYLQGWKSNSDVIETSYSGKPPNMWHFAAKM